MPDNLLSTISDLARLGFAGVGVIVFLLVFILLMRGKPVEAETARLRERFLTYGVLFAVFCGILSVVTPLMEDEKPAGGPVKMRLAFSPDFGTEQLTPPKIRLPDGTVTDPESAFAVPPADVTQVLTIGMDTALREVKSLRQTTASLAQSVAVVQEQRDTLARSAAPASAPPAAQNALEAKSQETEKLQQEVSASIGRGDFRRAEVLSVELRKSVAQTQPALDRLALPEG